MSAPRDGAAARERGLAHLRHELRTSLTGVLGYSEHLVESAPPGASPDAARALRALVPIGRGMLALVNEGLSHEALERLDDEAVRAAVQGVASACLESAARLHEACAALIAACERDRWFEAIPVLCRIQAAGATLKLLLEERALDNDPRSRWLGPPPGRRSSRSAPPAAPRVEAPGGRILIADDNPVARDLLRTWLEQQGHEIEEAASGAAALEAILRGDHDLVLLDLIMPDMDGLDVLIALGREGRLGLAPIIMLSASDEAPRIAACIEHGAEDYVAKPFHMVLLRARVRAALELHRHRRRERGYLAMLQDHRDRDARGR